MPFRIRPRTRQLAFLALASLLTRPFASATARAADRADIEFLGNGIVGVYADPNATQRCASIPTGSFATLHVVATLGGDTSAGLTGAEFRIEVSNPTGWFFSYAPPPGSNLQIGTVFDLTPGDPNDFVGLNIAFPMCQTAPHVDLGTILAFNQGGGPTNLVVKRKNPSSNPRSTCPLFTQCDSPRFTITCMGTCATDRFGEDIASTMALNDSSCTDSVTCPADCPGAPCVSIAPIPDQLVCLGEPVVVTARITNCGTVPEDLDAFIDYQAAGSFPAVAPGATVTITRTIVQTDCFAAGALRHPVGVVARNTSCPQPFGDEAQAQFICDSRVCGGNRPPDCSGAHATVT